MRKKLFCKTQNVERIPPTQDALYQHCLRAVYQARIWVSAHDCTFQVPDPCLYGWKKEGDKLLPVWITIPAVLEACRELIKCGCKKPCSRACTCKKQELECTRLCKCQCVRE